MVQGSGGCYCCTETLAEEDGAGHWVAEVMTDIGYQGYGVGDDAGFGGNVRGVLERGDTEAPVVAGQEMSFWDAGN